MANPSDIGSSILRRAIAPVAHLTVAALCMVDAHAQVPGGPGLDAGGLLAGLYPDAECAQQRVIGICHCGSLPCGLRVERYVPVAIVETTRAPGDSLFAFLPLPAATPGSTASSALSTTDNTAEVHVWSLPAAPIPGAACLTCGAIDAARPATATDRSAAVCGPSAAVARSLATFAPSALWGPRLAYASELDALNWRTGCRDLADPMLAMLAGPLACLPGAGYARPGLDAACLGAWGPLMPRQMRDIGPTPPLFSARTAMRAMSIARDQIGGFPFPVDTNGKLQQLYPAPSACFRVGQLPLPQAPALRPVRVSPDGRYAWIYWRPASCCVGLANAQQCLRAR